MVLSITLYSLQHTWARVDFVIIRLTLCASFLLLSRAVAAREREND